MYKLYQQSWARSFDFKGCSSRREFASFFAVSGGFIVIFALLSIVFILLSQGFPPSLHYLSVSTLSVGGLLASVSFLQLITSVVPAVSLMVRRTRDIGLPIFSSFAFLVPVAGIFAFALCFFLPSDFIAQCRGFRK